MTTAGYSRHFAAVLTGAASSGGRVSSAGATPMAASGQISGSGTLVLTFQRHGYRKLGEA